MNEELQRLMSRMTQDQLISLLSYLRELTEESAQQAATGSASVCPPGK